MTQQLVFLWTTPALILSAVFLLGGAILCFSAWRRSGYARGTGFLESLRWTLMALIAAGAVIVELGG